MADYYDKLSIQKSSNQLAINRARQTIQNTGRALPCRVVKVSGAIVTVAFEVQSYPQSLPNITIPKAESPWIRMPTQVGDKGVTMPADVYLGGVSGLGGGTATAAQRGNLTALVFVPISNANSGPIDQNAAQVQGPNGAILQTTSGTTSSAVVNQQGVTLTFGTASLVVNALGITMTFGSKTIVLNGSGLIINGESYENHTHGYFPGGGTKTQTDPPIN
jgi:hypothetical protein